MRTEIMLLGPGRTPGYGVFHNIRELKPGQYAWYDHKGMRLTTYFHLQDREHPDDFATTVQTVHDLVTDSIRRQLIADVDVATFLSYLQWQLGNSKSREKHCTPFR